MSSVRAELALSLESRFSARARRRGCARGEEVALALGIDALLDRSTHEPLRWRAAAGRARRRALAGRPPVVLLDELHLAARSLVAGDELFIGLLRRLNEEWETTIVLAEHRLERCLSAPRTEAITLEAVAVRTTATPASFLAWAARNTSRHCRRPARSCSPSPACAHRRPVYKQARR